MSIRPNPSGQDKNISWGHLGNFRKYKNVASKDDKEKTLEERKREIFEKMKPYNSEDYIDKALFVVGGAGVYETPTPPVETFHITAEDNSPLLTEAGDFIDFDFV